jgi:hypothetical protein
MGQRWTEGLAAGWVASSRWAGGASGEYLLGGWTLALLSRNSTVGVG